MELDQAADTFVRHVVWLISGTDIFDRELQQGGWNGGSDADDHAAGLALPPLIVASRRLVTDHRAARQ